MLHSRASANSVIRAIMSNANGIGVSKVAARNNSDIKGNNGKNISSMAHSIKATQNLRTVATQYVNYVNDNYDGKVLNNINEESAKEFLNSKMEDINGNSLNTYISEMSKIADNLNQLGHDSFTRSSMGEYREELKEQGVDLKGEHFNRAYEDAEKIVSDMYENSAYGLSAELQYEAGLRADDALNSDKWELTDHNTLLIHESKGGITYETAQLSDDLISRVEQAIEQGYSVPYNDYKEILQEVVIENGEDWNGTHGLRYDFAQERFEELKEQGLEDNEALATVSLEMGHSRTDITLHYLNQNDGNE